MIDLFLDWLFDRVCDLLELVGPVVFRWATAVGDGTAA